MLLSIYHPKNDRHSERSEESKVSANKLEILLMLLHIASICKCFAESVLSKSIEQQEISKGKSIEQEEISSILTLTLKTDSAGPLLNEIVLQKLKLQLLLYFLALILISNLWKIFRNS